MFKRTQLISILVLAFSLVAVQASFVCVDVASAQEGLDRRDHSRKRSRDWIDRIRNTSPEVRDAQRKKMLERLADAPPEERRRLLRRQRRIMRFLPEEERQKIRRERQRFAEKYDLGTARDREGWDALRELNFTSEERRILRGRVHQLSKAERRELRDQILNVRRLPKSEREILRDRLHEMKSLTDDEKRALALKIQRWSQMSDQKRERLRAQMKRIRSLPPEERLQLLEKAEAAAKLNN